MTVEEGVRVDLIFGVKELKPVRYTRRTERRGLGNWWWIIECEFSRLTNGPFWTEQAAKADMARYPI